MVWKGVAVVAEPVVAYEPVTNGTSSTAFMVASW
jgi:hypothetical protein